MNATVGTHRKTRANLLHDLGRSDRRDEDLLRAAVLAQPERSFESNLTERVDAHLDAIGDDSAAILAQMDANVEVDDPFQGDENAAHRAPVNAFST